MAQALAAAAEAAAEPERCGGTKHRQGGGDGVGLQLEPVHRKLIVHGHIINRQGSVDRPETSELDVVHTRDPCTSLVGITIGSQRCTAVEPRGVDELEKVAVPPIFH